MNHQTSTAEIMAEALAILEPAEPYHEFHGPGHQTPDAEIVLETAEAIWCSSYILLTEEGITAADQTRIDRAAESLAALGRAAAANAPTTYFDDDGVQC